MKITAPTVRNDWWRRKLRKVHAHAPWWTNFRKSRVVDPSPRALVSSNKKKNKNQKSLQSLARRVRIMQYVYSYKLFFLSPFFFIVLVRECVITIAVRQRVPARKSSRDVQNITSPKTGVSLLVDWKSE